MDRQRLEDRKATLRELRKGFQEAMAGGSDERHTENHVALVAQVDILTAILIDLIGELIVSGEHAHAVHELIKRPALIEGDRPEFGELRPGQAPAPRMALDSLVPHPTHEADRLDGPWTPIVGTPRKRYLKSIATAGSEVAQNGVRASDQADGFASMEPDPRD